MSGERAFIEAQRIASPSADSVTDHTRNGTETAIPQSIAAAGATQGAATLITKAQAMITTCTASARGVKLPAAATGLMVRLYSLCTQGTKVYPNTNDKHAAAATNVAAVIAGFKANIYHALDATTWALLKGA